MATINVSNIAPSTNEKELRDFFSYCGKINELSLKPGEGSESTQSATITFERKPAAHTALLLDNTQLTGNNVKIEAAASLADLADQQHTGDPEHEIRQEDKPRTAVLAEYLSHGYTLADNVLQRGISLDEKHGISTKFKAYLSTLDNRTNATPTMRSVDTTYGVTDKAAQGLNTAQRYLEQALNTPTGQKIRAFYDVGQKNVLDIHNEAMRLKKMRENKSCTCGGDSGACGCPAGECKCEGCAPGATSAAPAGAGKSGVHGIGEGKTKCNCGGNEGECGCAPGECACTDCPKTKAAKA